MRVRELSIPDAFELVPDMVPDDRGRVYDVLRPGPLSAATGHPFAPAQVTMTVSRRGVVRGIHGVTLPPGQAKYVSCLRGAAQDVVVDMRLGSPTFGSVITTRLDPERGTSIYLAEGLGHATLALTADTWVSYSFSCAYVPGTSFVVNPFDRGLGIPWELTEDLTTSPGTDTAPTLAQAADRGLLPAYDACLRHYEHLRNATRAA